MSKAYKREASKRGYEDFDPTCLPADLCPYRSDDAFEEYKYGWRTAQLEHERHQQEDEEAESQFTITSLSCPWYESDICIATQLKCEMKYCAVQHFLERGL